MSTPQYGRSSLARAGSCQPQLSAVTDRDTGPAGPAGPADPAPPAEAGAPSGVPGGVLRVERGQAEPEELAAITAVLLARAAATPPAADTGARSKAGWRRLEREPGYHAPHSWRR